MRLLKVSFSLIIHAMEQKYFLSENKTFQSYIICLLNVYPKHLRKAHIWLLMHFQCCCAWCFINILALTPR